MEKIRECGSTITYYGGQVMPKVNDENLMTNGSFVQLNSSNNASHSVMTLTRRRAREIETCNVCQPNPCPHKKELQDKFAETAAKKTHNINSKDYEPNQQKDVYQGE